MRIFVVEDDVFQLEDILITLEELNYECVGNTDTAPKAIEEIELLKPDVVLIDIHLKGKQTGISLAKSIRTRYHIPIIFTTSEKDKDYMVQAASVTPVAYLTKPVNPDDLHAALVLAENSIPSSLQIEKKELSNIFVKNGNKLVKVALDSILFIHTDEKNYCSIVTLDKKKLTVRKSILGIYKLLGEENFMQTHRSHIINWKFIEAYHEYDQTLEIQGYHVPVGRTFRDSILKRLRVI